MASAVWGEGGAVAACWQDAWRRADLMRGDEGSSEGECARERVRATAALRVSGWMDEGECGAEGLGMRAIIEGKGCQFGPISPKKPLLWDSCQLVSVLVSVATVWFKQTKRN
jgi:hypothetical protein